MVPSPSPHRIHKTFKILPDLHAEVARIANSKGISYNASLEYVIHLGVSKAPGISASIDVEKDTVINQVEEQLETIERLISQFTHMMQEDHTVEHVCESCLKKTESLYRKKKIEEIIFCQSCGKQTPTNIPVKSDGDIYLFCPDCHESGKYIQRLQALAANY